MLKIFYKVINSFIGRLLTFFIVCVGIPMTNCGMNAMYGSPMSYAYKKIWTTDTNSTPIPNLQLTVVNNQTSITNGQPYYTDSNGFAEITVSANSGSMSTQININMSNYTVDIQDVDGTNNGVYQATNIVLDYTNDLTVIMH